MLEVNFLRDDISPGPQSMHKITQLLKISADRVILRGSAIYDIEKIRAIVAALPSVYQCEPRSVILNLDNEELLKRGKYFNYYEQLLQAANVNG